MPWRAAGSTRLGNRCGSRAGPKGETRVRPEPCPACRRRGVKDIHSLRRTGSIPSLASCSRSNCSSHPQAHQLFPSPTRTRLGIGSRRRTDSSCQPSSEVWQRQPTYQHRTRGHKADRGNLATSGTADKVGPVELLEALEAFIGPSDVALRSRSRIPAFDRPAAGLHIREQCWPCSR